MALPNSTTPPPDNSGNPFGPRRPMRPRQPYETPGYNPGNSGYAQPVPQSPAPYSPPPAPAPPPAPRSNPGIPSPLFGGAQRNAAPRTNQPAPPLPPAQPARPNVPRPRMAGMQLGNNGGGPTLGGSWNQLQQDNFNALSRIDPTLIWANQQNNERGLFNEDGGTYGGAEAAQVMSLLPPRIKAQVQSGAMPLHMALIQYMDFLRGLGITNAV